MLSRRRRLRVLKLAMERNSTRSRLVQKLYDDRPSWSPGLTEIQKILELHHTFIRLLRRYEASGGR